ncbi:MAG: helix-turn-helix transcriptional regulator [Planctomycetia bacterium]|nr:helix-turn-helix transcriptional regulator [Planctomycetia bacterium]
MGKKYNTVLGMVNEISEDKDFNKSLEKEIKGRQISKTLFSMRCKRGLTQSQLAEKAHFSQGKISKIEKSFDTDLTMKDLAAYCSALNMRVEIGFSDMRITLADRVKYHYFMLKTLLDEMRGLAKGDKTMEAGVEKFTREAFVNITFGLLACLQKAKPEEEKGETIHVSNPINLEDFAEDIKNENEELVS